VKHLGVVAGFVLLVAGCGEATTPRRVADSVASAPRCPASAVAGWRRLADRIQAPVYCPRWMPAPLDGRIDGRWIDVNSVDPDRSYLISFLWHEARGGDVHVNFRGYPGRVRIPRCVDNNTRQRRLVPCFSDPRGRIRLPGIHATLYTVNQDADQWHVLYAWRRGGSLYAVSEHVTPPLTYRHVQRNLARILRNLVLVEPRT
jgi:hypothetical protein